MELRCFIAVALPETVKDSLGDVLNILRKSPASVRWIPPENIHLTIKFLGQTDQSLITPMKESLNKKLLTYKPFYITITDVGCFPNERRPRLVWIGIKRSESLSNLQKEIDADLVKFGFSLEKREFSPHLTIGRVKAQHDLPGMLRMLKELRSSSFANMEVKSISLMQSILKPAGAQYFTLAEIPFGRRNDAE